MAQDRHRPKHAKYFEGILQIREAPDEVFVFAEKAMDEAKNSGIFVSKVEEFKTGLDYFLSSRHFTMDLGRKLKKRFKGKLVLSRKLFGVHKQNSKLLYRVTVLYRHINERPKEPDYDTSD
ncbi:MAG: NMD3-related protein [Candidatus Woesearchaeota archaeon]